MSVPAYQLLAYISTPKTLTASTIIDNYIGINANSSPGVVITYVDVPATTSALTGIDVEITDVDFQNTLGTTATIVLQMGVSGFGTGSTSPIDVKIGHTADAGAVPVPSYGMYYGNIRWFLPQGATVAGKTVDLQAGGTVYFSAYVPAYTNDGSILVGMSYLIVWGVYSSVV